MSEKFNIRAAIRNASARSFGLHLFKVDTISEFVLGVLVGVLAFAGSVETVFLRKLLVAALAFVCASASYVSFRVIIAYSLSIDYADMLRVRYPFFVWLASSMLCVCLAAPIRVLFGAYGPMMVQATLMMVAVSQVLRFILAGGVWRLAIAYLLCGVLVGWSFFGVVALLICVGLLFKVKTSIYASSEYGDGRKDAYNKEVVHYFTNSIVNARAKWLQAICLIAGAFGILAFNLHGRIDPSVSISALLENEFRAVWCEGLTLGGVVLLLVFAVIPFLIGLVRVKLSTDMTRPTSFVDHACYLGIGGVSVLLLVYPRILSLVAGVPVVADPRLWFVILASCGMNILLAAMVLIIDMRCRRYLEAEFEEARQFSGLMQISMVPMVVLPLILLMVSALMAIYR